MKSKDKLKGKLIVIDGIDGSGKATQTALLVAALRSQGRRVETMSFPQYTENFFGAIIRQCLDGKYGDFLAVHPLAASALYAADRFESSAKIRALLEDGVDVVLDRYVSSNQIHQGSKCHDEAERTEFLSQLDNLEYGVFKIPRPDVIVYLSIPVEVSLRLIAERDAQSGNTAPKDMAEQNPEHLEASRQSALAMIANQNNWVQVDCLDHDTQDLLSREAVHAEVMQVVQKFLE